MAIVRRIPQKGLGVRSNEDDDGVKVAAWPTGALSYEPVDDCFDPNDDGGKHLGSDPNDDGGKHLGSDPNDDGLGGNVAGA